MKTCSTCSYWDPESRYCGPKTHGSCNCAAFLYAGVDPPAAGPDTLTYADWEGYAAGFATGPDFGCIHHKGESK